MQQLRILLCIRRRSQQLALSIVHALCLQVGAGSKLSTMPGLDTGIMFCTYDLLKGGLQRAKGKAKAKPPQSSLVALMAGAEPGDGRYASMLSHKPYELSIFMGIVPLRALQNVLFGHQEAC